MALVAPDSPLHRLRVILVRPQVAGNIGAVARAMENFAAGQLVLVQPKANPLSRESLERSTHGEHRLHSARIVETLEQALDGVVFAIGTSRRRGPVHQEQDYDARDLGRLIAPRVRDGDVALLFGTEDNGLSREELLACDALVQIPAQSAYPTLNLSHAATICLYEAYLALAAAEGLPGTVPQPTTDAAAAPSNPKSEIQNPKSALADLALMERLMAKLQHALLTIGYLHAEKPDHLMFPIRAILSRANLTRGEAQILIGLAQQIDEFAQYGRK